MAAPFRAFIGVDPVAKKAGEYHVPLMHRGFDEARVDMATEWATLSSEPHEVVPMMALYENHACRCLGVVAGDWRHINPPAPTPAQGNGIKGAARSGPTTAAY